LLQQIQGYLAFGPATIFLHPRFTYLLIPSLTHKHETKTLKSQHLLITNQLDQLICLANEDQVLDYVVAFASLSMLSKNVEPHPFYLALWANFYWPWFKICCVVCWWRCSYDFSLVPNGRKIVNSKQTDFKYIILHNIIFNQFLINQL